MHPITSRKIVVEPKNAWVDVSHWILHGTALLSVFDGLDLGLGHEFGESKYHINNVKVVWDMNFTKSTCHDFA
jgi:hypothetical protein